MLVGSRRISGFLLQSSRTPDPNSNHYLEEHSSGHVQHNVMPASRPRRNKRLVKFIQTRGQQGGCQGQSTPAPSPPSRLHESSTPGEEREQAEHPITAKVSGLADQKMDLLKAVMGNWPVDKTDDLHQDHPGVRGREKISRESGQQAQPEERREPDQQQITPWGHDGPARKRQPCFSRTIQAGSWELHA